MGLMTSRSPLRVSFFGGGTDYPAYFNQYKGAVIGTAINKHVYTSAIELEKFMGYSFRLAYRITEEVQDVSEIEHPMVRAALQYFGLKSGWNFSILTSLPSRSGLGSSSSFAVGLLKLLGHMQGVNLTRHDLASLAIHIEHDLLNENVGVQDQMHAAYGGLNRYEFDKNDFSIHPVRLHAVVRDLLNSSMYLVHTGVQRFASKILEEQMAKTKERTIIRELDHLYALTHQAHRLLESKDVSKTLEDFGAMLNEGWMTKRSMSSAISRPDIDEIYDTAIRGGAIGGKLCGAGGGGFFLLVVPQHMKENVEAAIAPRTLIPIQIDDVGVTLLGG